MQANATKNQTTPLSFFKTLILGLMLALGVTSCGGGSSAPAPPVDANPEGFYDAGTASVKMSDDTTDLSFADLRAMVSGTRFMALSESQVLLYDGTITNITGNAFTATVNIYKDGVLLAGGGGDGHCIWNDYNCFNYYWHIDRCWGRQWHVLGNL